jgi:hypothetical protein
MAEQEHVRAARNQTLYRLVNEKIQPINEAFSETLQMEGEWVCECPDEHCTEPIQMTLAENEELRSPANRFAVYPATSTPRSKTSSDKPTAICSLRRPARPGQIAIEANPRQ